MLEFCLGNADAFRGVSLLYLEKTLNNVEYTLRVMCLTLGLTKKQMIVEPAFKIIWHNDIFHQ